MADIPEGKVPPPAVDQSGNLTIWWVEKIADVSAPKLTELAADTASRITYSFTTDGYSIEASQEKESDERLTKKQTLQVLGAIDIQLKQFKYVDSEEKTSAAQLLLENKEGFIVERRNVPNGEASKAGQAIRVIPVKLGAQLPGEIDGAGKFTIIQEVAITGEVGLPVKLVA